MYISEIYLILELYSWNQTIIFVRITLAYN